MITVDHLKFVLNEKMELMKLSSMEHRYSYDEGYMDGLDFVLNLLEDKDSSFTYLGSYTPPKDMVL